MIEHLNLASDHVKLTSDQSVIKVKLLIEAVIYQLSVPFKNNLIDCVKISKYMPFFIDFNFFSSDFRALIINQIEDHLLDK